jgi:hypothetical protein
MRTERWKDGVLVEIIETSDDKERLLKAERATVNQMVLAGEILITKADVEFATRQAVVENLPPVVERHLVRDQARGILVERIKAK